jgi:hypothetical protein
LQYACSRTVAHPEETNKTPQILSSFAVALTLVFKSSEPTFTKLSFNAVNIAVCYLARTHIHNYWTGKAKVPFVQGYNDAINSTTIIRDQLTYLAGTWALTSLVEVWRLATS